MRVASDTDERETVDLQTSPAVHTDRMPINANSKFQRMQSTKECL